MRSSPICGSRQRHRAEQSDAEADSCADEKIDRRGTDPRGVRDLFGHGPGDEEVDERCGDAVVQPTFDIEHSPHTRRNPLVLHDRRAERGVGRSND